MSSDFEQMAMFDIAEGERFMFEAKEWIKLNHETWHWMCGQAMKYASLKKRFSIARLVEEARYTRPVKGVNEYKIDNKTRSSKVDL